MYNTFRCQHDTHLKLLHPCAWGGFDAALPNDSILTSASRFPPTISLGIRNLSPLPKNMFAV